MEIRQLKTFLTVAKLLNFNRAAENLHYAQSTVSSQIKLLEEEFGVSLFDRLGRRVALTEAGRMLVRYSRKIIDLEEETLARISGWEKPGGSLSIRIPQSLGTYHLPGVLKRFQTLFPKVGFDVSACAFHTLEQELRTGVIDLAFLLAESIQSSDLMAEALGIEPVVFVAHPGHPLVRRDVMRLRDLEGETILLPKHDCAYKMMFDRILAEEKVGSGVIMEMNSIEAIKRCVMEGVGLTMIPRVAVKREIDNGKLVLLPWVEEQLETAILMIWHKDKWLSPTLRAFMETVREVIKPTDSPG